MTDVFLNKKRFLRSLPLCTMKLTLTIIALFVLTQFSTFGQSVDSLILGNWRWNDRGDSIVNLTRINKIKRKPTCIYISDTDTMYRSVYGPYCGNSKDKFKYVFRRGHWHFGSTGFFVIKYEHREVYIEEQFKIVDYSKRRITLKKVKHIDNEIVKD
jgi:hypothetical protein